LLRQIDPEPFEGGGRVTIFLLLVS
jgi:hypothetical protein